jgi:hypothetical protein
MLNCAAEIGLFGEMFNVSKPLYELVLFVEESLYMISSKMTLPPENGRTLPFDFNFNRSGLLLVTLSANSPERD